MDLPHHGGGCSIRKIDCPPVVGLSPGIFGRELVEAAAVDADDDEGGGEETVGAFEGAGVFESGGEGQDDEYRDDEERYCDRCRM